MVAVSCQRSLLHVVLPLISRLGSAIHNQNKGKNAQKINTRHLIYSLTNLYLWTFIPYFNKKVCKHTYTYMKVVWISPVFKRQAVTAEKGTVNYKNNFFHCSLQQHLTSPLTWFIRIHIRRVNTIYTLNLFTSAKPERGHKELNLHSHSAWQLKRYSILSTGVCGR